MVKRLIITVLVDNTAGDRGLLGKISNPDEID